MSSISSGTLVNTGLVVASDTSGNLVVKTGATGNTAAVFDANGSVNFGYSVTHGVGTANGVAYLNGSKVVTTGSALTFDGTNFATTGTATATKLIPTGTSVTGNGMYLPATNSIGISTAGTNAVYIDASQNVGIGTSSPAGKLDVTGSLGKFTIDASGTSVSLTYGVANYIRASSASGNLNVGAYDYLSFQTGSGFTDRMRIDSSGNVFIGGSSGLSAERFYVRGATLGGTSGNTSYNSVFYTPDVTNATRLSILDYRFSNGTSHISSRNLIQRTVDVTNMGYVGFDSYATSIGWGTTEAMRIDSSGNVGIGTSSPAVKLDVNGITGWQGGTTGQTAQIVGASSGINGGGNFRVLSNTTQAVDVGGALTLGGYYTSTTASVDFGVILGAKENSTSGNTAGYLAFGTRPNAGNMTERMRIDSSGNLGLGITPSVWTTFSSVFEVPGGALAGISANQIGVWQNCFYNSSSFKYKSSAGATLYQQAGSSHVWYNAPSGTAGNAITFTQAMTLDASGRLLIGTTSGGAPLVVKVATNANFAVQNASGHLQLQGINDAGNAFAQLDLAGSFITLSPASSEAVRIDSSGNLIVGGTSPFGLITSLKNSAGGYSSAFTARAIGGANSQLTGYSFMPTFGNTADYTPRRAADMWGGFNAGNWGTEFLAFGVGTGTGNDGGSLTTERMRITGDGAVLVGSTSAIAGYTQVSVTGSSTNRGAFVMGRTTAATTGVAGTLVAYNGSNAVCGMDFQSNSANNSGYIGTYTYNAGAFAQGPYLNTGGTSWTTASDQNLKDVTGEITNALNKVSQIRAVEFTWKADESKKQHVGFIAQDVQAVLPEVIDTDTNGYLGVRYAEVTSLLLAAIKEQQTLIESLTTRLTALEQT